MSRSSTCSPYSSAARSLPIAAASLRTCQKVTLRDGNLVSWNRAKHAEGNLILYNEHYSLLWIPIFCFCILKELVSKPHAGHQAAASNCATVRDSSNLRALLAYQEELACMGVTRGKKHVSPRRIHLRKTKTGYWSKLQQVTSSRSHRPSWQRQRCRPRLRARRRAGRG